MRTKILKQPLSCRVNPQLRKDIEQEAQDNEMTLSYYLELLLKNRHRDDGEEESEQPEEMQRLNDYIDSLETENAELREELSSEDVVEVDDLDEIFGGRTPAQVEEEFEQEDSEMEESDDEEFEMEEVLPASPQGIQVSASKEEELNSYLEKLKGSYPDLEIEDLILRSLQSAVENETSFLFIHTIKGYKPYPISSPKNDEQ